MESQQDGSWGKVLTHKSADLYLISRTYMVEAENQLPKVVLFPTFT